METKWSLRLAREEDVAALEILIPLSARSLQSASYSSAQIDAALGPVFGVDHQLIRDGTYFVVETGGASSGEPVTDRRRGAPPSIIGCGGWSKRKSLFGSDVARVEQDAQLNPDHDAARVRAFFVHPAWSRRGLGHAILDACEDAIRTAQFHSIELVATLVGEPFYAAFGYIAVERYEIPMRGGLALPVVRMAKEFPTPIRDQ